ncbi:hypothetical protein SCUCBS95973_002372 [Sporothrix curviconia]|uniref:Uncharacterized protein n=1 Tax=Sporothrix curviconia TaxID=1260050 RepID=A0ABP0B6C8_9PEZI
MAQVSSSTEPAPGVVIDQGDGKITITITTKSPSDDRPTLAGRNTRGLWHAAYKRLRSEASGLAYIVSRITYYDRLSLLLPTIPDFDSDDDDDDHDDEIDNPLYAALVSLYAAVLNQLILVIWANRMPHESGTEDDSPLMFGHTGMGFDSAAVHPIVVLESSVMEHARDKALEESIAELVRLLSLPPTSSDENGGLDNNARDPTIATDNLDDGNNHNDLRVDTGAGGNSDDRKTKADADDQGHNASSGIRGVLCAAHIQPPHSPPSDASPAVLEELYQWALEQDEFQKWLKAHATDRGSPDDRILLVHNPRSTSITMLLVDVLSEKVSTLADTENKVADMDAGRPRYALARASSDWSRDIDGTSVVSVVRDLIWIVLQNQPELKSHLENAVQTMNRRPLLGGDDNETKATSAVRGSSCDFYAALALLCRIVEDTRFQPTCFVVDYVDVMLDGVDGVYHSDKDGGDDNGKGDESERGSANVAQNGTARTSRKRGWTVRDLMALVRTTCSLSRNVSWVVLSSSMESSFLGDVGGRRLVPSPADSTLAEITHHFLRALLQQHLYPTYTSELLDELADIAHVNSDGVVSCRAFAKDLVDVPPEAMVDILSTLPRDDRLELQRPLSWIYDGLRSKNLAPIGAINDPSGEQLTHTVINAFQPLTALELTALTSLPGAVDAILRTPGIVRPVVDVREVHGGSGQAPDYYFCSSQASGAKRWVDSVDHTKMVVRHLRCLAEHYDASVPRREAQLSIYVKTAWLRHLDRVDDSALRLVQWLGPLLSGFVTGTAEAWLNDLETLGVTPVVWGMLQDLLPSPSTGGTLSPIAAALEALVARIAASEAMTVTPAEARQFLHMAGWYAGHDKPDTDKILPVLPQSPPVSLPGLPAPGNAELAEAKRKIGSLVGHTDKVCDCYWSYDGRLLVTISDDDTLQCWDRATLRRQCVTNHTFQGSLVMLSLSRTDPNALIALSRWEVVQFDLAKGAVPVARKSYSEGDLIEAPDETDSVMFSYMQFSGNDSSSLIVTCNTLPNGQTPAVVLRVPQLELQEVRYIEYGYKCLPSAVANALSHAPADDALQESDCLGAAMAHDLNLAAIVREDGSFDIYDTELARTIQETTSEVNWLSLSSNEELLMACYDSGKTDIWSTESGERVANLTGHNSWVRMAAFSPGNTLVATASFDGLVRLWDVEACRRAYVEACRRENQALEEVRSDDDSETGDNKTEGRLFDDNGDGQNAEDGKEESSDAAATDNIINNDGDGGPDDNGGDADDKESGEIQKSDSDADSDDDNVDDNDDSSMSSSTSSPSSSSVGEHWDPRATVVAGGFSVPGQDTLWDYQPRRLSISEGVDGQYLLHTEIGVWVLPIPGRMAIFWKGQLLSKFPDMFAPTKQYYFSSYACGVYTTDSETSTLITGTKNGKVLCFRYRDRESGEKTADETDTADSNEKQAGFSTEPHDQNGKASENEVDKTGQTKDGSTELVS